MPNRTDYLRDLAAHPGSLAVEVLSRLKAPTVNAVETQFRKLQSAELVSIEATKPRRYRLTEKGKEELALATSEPDSTNNEMESAQTQETSGSLKKLVAPFFVPLIHNEVCREVEAEMKRRGEQTNLRGDSEPVPPQSNNQRVKTLQDKASRLLDPEETEEATTQSQLCMRELLGIERGLSELPRRELRTLRDSLRERIADEGMCEKVSRLVEAEAKLSEQNDGWWSDQDVAKQLEEEIAGLRKELGLAEQTEESDVAAIGFAG